MPNIINISKLASVFAKQAGIFEAPPAMVQKLTKSVLDIYASAVFFVAVRHHRDAIIRAAKQYTTTSHWLPYTSFLLDVDLSGWKYLDAKKQQLFNNWKKEDLIDQFITCNIVFVDGAPKNHGEFYSNTNTINIFINSNSTNTDNIKEFRYNIEDIKRTVRHELQHYGQMLLNSLIRVGPVRPGSRGNGAGLPSNKIRSKEQDYFGRMLSPNSSYISTDHQLIDSEFYTNLSDSIDRFINTSKYIPHNLLKEFAKVWVGEKSNFTATIRKDIELFNSILKSVYIGPQEPFTTLKIKSPEKWRKAVKEFYSKIRYLL